MAGDAGTPQPVRNNIAIVQPEERKGKSLDERYDLIVTCRAAVWITAIVVLGLSAGIISKKPHGFLLAAAAYNLAAAAFQFFTVWIGSVKPVSRTNARPSGTFFASLSFSSAVWLSAFVIMIVARSRDDAYEIVHLEKRIGIIVQTGTTVVNLLENITIACGAMGAGAFLGCLVQWYYVLRIIAGEYSDEEILDVYASGS